MAQNLAGSVGMLLAKSVPRLQGTELPCAQPQQGVDSKQISAWRWARRDGDKRLLPNGAADVRRGGEPGQESSRRSRRKNVYGRENLVAWCRRRWRLIVDSGRRVEASLGLRAREKGPREKDSH